MSISLVLCGVPGLYSTFHPDTITFINNISSIGGLILAEDILAIDNFVKTIYKNNLRYLFKAFYPYAGQNLLTARQGLWVPEGINIQLQFVGNPFMDYNYSRTTGITGDSTQGFDTGFSSNGLSNWSYSVYLITGGNNSSQIGTGFTNSDFLAQNFSGITYYSDAGNFIDTTTQGWYTAQSMSLLRNGIIVDTTSGLAASDFTIYIHGRNRNNSLFQGSNRSIGCAAICTTRTAEQDLIIYNAVQSLMTVFGRNV